MSFLDLLDFEDSRADAVIGAVRQWCQKHGVSLDSEDGKNAMSVAVRVARSADIPNEGIFAHLEKELSTSSEPALVLLIEDEPFITLDVAETLQSVGYRVTSFSSSAEAILWLDKDTPDAAVLDINLRGSPCVEVVARLTDLGVPFIVHSGAHPSDAPPIFRSAEWVPKPCLPDDLPKAVDGVLGRRSALKDLRTSL